MDEQRQDDQLEPTYSSFVPIRDVALRTYRKQSMIGRRGERGPGISVLIAGLDNDDEVSSNVQDSSQYSGRFFTKFAIPPIFFPSPWKPFQVHQKQFVFTVTSTFHSYFFLALWQNPKICLSFRILLFPHSGPQGRQTPLIYLLFLLINIRPSLLSGIRRSVCIRKTQRILCVRFFQTEESG